jgi:hypothetical protein
MLRCIFYQPKMPTLHELMIRLDTGVQFVCLSIESVLDPNSEGLVGMGWYQKHRRTRSHEFFFAVLKAFCMGILLVSFLQMMFYSWEKYAHGPTKNVLLFTVHTLIVWFARFPLVLLNIVVFNTVCLIEDLFLVRE